MNSTDEETPLDKNENNGMNEKVEISEEKDEIVEDEPIENYDDLMSRKERILNEFDVEGNVAQTQTFIQNAKDVIFYISNSEPVRKTRDFGDKAYDLRKAEECVEFIETYQHSAYLSIALILCSFHIVALGDLFALQIKIKEYLSLLEGDKEQVMNHQNLGVSPYISLDGILFVIGGRRFELQNGQQCVTLGDDSIKALKNVVEQFPVLRSILVSWLMDINREYEYHTTLDVYQITTALARVISLDIKDAEYRVFPQLYLRKENTLLLASLFYCLYKCEEIKENVRLIYLDMMKKDGIWLLVSNCIACSFFAEDGMAFPLESELKKEIKKKWLYLQEHELYFLAGITFKTEKIRDVLIETLSDVYKSLSNKKKKNRLVYMYLSLVRYGYYQIKPSMHALPLVVCDSRKQQELLAPILEQIVCTYRLRKQLYVILRAYIKDLYRFKVSDKEIRYLSAFFYNLTLAGTDYREDVFDFLIEVNNGITKEILKLLGQNIRKGEEKDD